MLGCAVLSAAEAGGCSFKRGGRYDIACKNASAAELRSSQRDAFSWTALISKHLKSGQGRQALKIYEEMRESGVRPDSRTYVVALKACGILKDLTSAKEIHAEVVKCGLEQNLVVGTMLVDTYAKCGSLMEARRVFDKMSFRDVVSWNAMIVGYAQREEGAEALQLYAEMQHQGVMPNDRTFVGALKACSSLAALEERNGCDRQGVKQQCLEKVRALHSDVVKGNFESDVFVGTMLVDAYAKCGSLVDARCVFEKMPHRNVVSWNAMIWGYAQMEQGQEALQLFVRMQQEGVVPKDRTFVAALRACTSLATVEEGDESVRMLVKKRYLDQVRAIHSDIVKRGSELDVFVGTLLVDAYAKCGSLVDARRVFETMPHRDVVLWTALILGYAQADEGEEALHLYEKMRLEGVAPNDRTYVGAVKACSSLAALEDWDESNGKREKKRCLDKGRAIHSDLVRSGFESDLFVGNMLVDMYAKCGSLGDARHVFEKMPHRDVVSWNTMILGYAQMENGEGALQLFIQMQQEGLAPNDRTFVAALKACSSLAAIKGGIRGDGNWCLEQVRTIHFDVVRCGYELDVFVGTMLVDVYAKCGNLVDAKCVFEKMPVRDVVSWNAMILGYVQMEDGEIALELYARMQQENVVPNHHTFVAVLKACGVVVGLDKGKEIHAQISKLVVENTDLFVSTALIDMYGKCGSMENAQKVFDALHVRNLVPWNALIAGYAQQGESEVVFDLFQRLRQERIQPDNITFLSLLTACSHVGSVDKAQKYFTAMSDQFGISPTTEHYNCMVDLLGRLGQLDKAVEMVKRMPFQPTGNVWRSLLAACQKWNNVELGRRAFEGAVSLEKNDAAAYVLMSNIYAGAQMLEEANHIQQMRVNTSGWKKPGQSWWTDMVGVVHAFVVCDQKHPQSQHIYARLQDLFAKLKEQINICT